MVQCDNPKLDNGSDSTFYIDLNVKSGTILQVEGCNEGFNYYVGSDVLCHRQNGMILERYKNVINQVKHIRVKIPNFEHSSRPVPFPTELIERSLNNRVGRGARSFPKPLSSLASPAIAMLHQANDRSRVAPVDCRVRKGVMSRSHSPEPPSKRVKHDHLLDGRVQRSVLENSRILDEIQGSEEVSSSAVKECCNGNNTTMINAPSPTPSSSSTEMTTSINSMSFEPPPETIGPSHKQQSRLKLSLNYEAKTLVDQKVELLEMWSRMVSKQDERQATSIVSKFKIAYKNDTESKIALHSGIEVAIEGCTILSPTIVDLCHLRALWQIAFDEERNQLRKW